MPHLFPHLVACKVCGESAYVPVIKNGVTYCWECARAKVIDGTYNRPDATKQEVEPKAQ